MVIVSNLRLAMFRFLDLLDFVAAFAEGRLERHRLVKREAATLIREAGTSALEAAQRIADLARQRGDRRAMMLWLDVVREIAKQEPMPPARK